MQVIFYTLSSSEDPNNIRYVGKTRQSLKRRLQGHICSASKNKDCVSNHNYNWINKEISKGNTIIISEIETIKCDTDDYWKLLEKYWICQFKTWGFDLTNIREGGEDNHIKTTTEDMIRKRREKIVGKPRDEKTKESISRSLSGHSKSQETIEKIRNSISAKQGRPVIQISMDGKFIKEWDTGAEAARYYNLDRANLNACCKGKKKSCGGYRWEFKFPDYIPQTKVAQVDEFRNIIKVYENSEEASRSLGINSVLINNVCRGKQESTYNMFFKYL